jgi:hypothetical protein
MLPWPCAGRTAGMPRAVRVIGWPPSDDGGGRVPAPGWTGPRGR